MAQTALAYELPVAQPQVEAPQLHAIPGKAKGVLAAPAFAPWIKTLGIMCALLVVTLASVSVARVSISNLTVQQLFQAQQTSTMISSARAAGSDLEVKHALLSNPTRVQDVAASKGVMPSRQVASLQARHGFSAEVQVEMAVAAQAQIAEEVAQMEAARASDETAANATTAEAATAEADTLAAASADTNTAASATTPDAATSNTNLGA